MASHPRLFLDDMYYHVYNRGNRKQQIFLSHIDYKRFLDKVIEYKKKYSVEIVSYCLMPNHIHFLLKQSAGSNISKFMSDLCNSHSRYFNVKYETVGALFQGRFKAKLVEKDEYLVHLSRYIHLNPVEILSFRNNDTIDSLLSYAWSSLPAYFLGKNNEIVNVERILAYFSSKDAIVDYKNFVVSNIRLESDPLVDHLLFDLQPRRLPA